MEEISADSCTWRFRSVCEDDLNKVKIDYLPYVRFLRLIVDLGCALVNVYAVEHSFVRTLADAIQRAHKGCKKKEQTMPSIQRSFYLRHVRTISAIFLHN